MRAKFPNRINAIERHSGTGAPDLHLQQGIAEMTTVDVTPPPAPPLAQLIFSDGTPKKAFLTALVVGTILTAINHGDTIIMGDWPPALKVILTYCTPYCVTTWGSVIGKRAQWRRDFRD